VRSVVCTRWAAAMLLVSVLLPLAWLVPPTAHAVIGACAPGFSEAAGSPITVETGPVEIAVGRFNGDAFDDLAVVNFASDSVTVLLGNGNGGFSPASGSPLSAGSAPDAVAVGRFNGDAFDDLAVARSGSNDVLILLGNGSGGFAPAPGSPVSVGSAPTAIAVGRFNGDSIDDLAVANRTDDTLTILLGNGSGGFSPTPGLPVGVGDSPASLAVGNLNGDGNADLAVANAGSNDVTILLGNGSGGFAPASGSPIGVGTEPRSVVVGSFNGDTAADLAVANLSSNSVTILLGNGSGGFAPAPGSPVNGGAFPSSVVVGSFNGDTAADLAVTNINFPGTVTTLLGNGSGGFAPAPGPPATVGNQPFAVAMGSFNGDAAADLAVANTAAASVTILLNTCLSADLGVSVAAAPDPVRAGSDLVYTVTAQNLGPDPAGTVSLSDPLPTGTTFVSLTAPGGWSCATPAVGATGTVTCSIATLPVASATFTLVVHIATGASLPSTLQNTVTIGAATADTVGTNNSASVGTAFVQTPTSTPTPPPSACVPRPAVAVAVFPAGTSRLLVTISPRTEPATPGNRLLQVRATIPANARIDVIDGPSDLTGQQVLPVDNGTEPVVFFVRRVAPGAITVPLVAVDTCGEWHTFVGRGATAL
jgi:uncharacterized repeat protein (TIGR01451 family)